MDRRRYVSVALLLVACAAESAPEAPVEPAVLALRYVPGEHPTDRRIAQAQADVRSGDGVEAHIALATAFIRRRRETSAPIMMTYADDAIRAARGLAPSDPRPWLLQGMSAQYGHRFKAAARMAEEIIAQHPELADAHLLLGDARLELGRYNQAIEAYQRAMDLRPDLRAYNRAAYVTWLHGDADGAIRLLDVALDSGSVRDPESSAWCYVDLGEIYRQQGDTARAIAAADRALALVPDYVPALTLRARANRAANHRTAALQDYRQAIRRLATVETLAELAELLEDEGDAPAAHRRWAQARSLAASDPRPWAHALARRGTEVASAVDFAERALAQRRGIFAWDTYGLALIRAGKLSAAQEALDRASALESPFAHHDLHRALLALAREQPVQARALLSQARAKNPMVDPRLVAEIEARLTEED